MDLERHGQLVRLRDEVDPRLEMAEIHRRVYQVGGPAILYERVKGSPFPAVSNLYGTLDRCRFIFRHSLERLKSVFALKADPSTLLKTPGRTLGALPVGWNALPRKVSRGPVLQHTTRVDQLPQVKCWPDDGGAFVLLPQVYTEDRDRPGVMGSNLGMYRIQLSGGTYKPNEEIGLHYQIQRGIGIHHTKAAEAGEPMRVSIFVGGPPAHAFAAVMYLPEALPEVAFAGALAGRRFRYIKQDGFTLSADADFCITGIVQPGQTKPEGPFGDHLGYYSLAHDFPYLKVQQVYHRPGAIWPFTVVGRPPQEDTSLGSLVQEIAGPMIPKEIPGIRQVHAVDASGVHPLLLAIGSERYVPYQKRRPQELHTLASALLGYGPCSLAKYLFIAAGEDDPNLDAHDTAGFFRHVLQRVDWTQDLHFQTCTTIDTLDYSGTGLNEGSKVVIATAGEPRRKLAELLPTDFSLPGGFRDPRFVMPGVLSVAGPSFADYALAEKQIKILTDHFEHLPNKNVLPMIPLILLTDDSEFTAANLNNFLWITFTRSNPSYDIPGAGSFTRFKHWGCTGPLIIDTRTKPHHAPPLIEDPKTTEKVNTLAAPGGPLHGII